MLNLFYLHSSPVVDMERIIFNSTARELMDYYEHRYDYWRVAAQSLDQKAALLDALNVIYKGRKIWAVRGFSEDHVLVSLAKIKEGKPEVYKMLCSYKLQGHEDAFREVAQYQGDLNTFVKGIARRILDLSGGQGDLQALVRYLKMDKDKRIQFDKLIQNYQLDPVELLEVYPTQLEEKQFDYCLAQWDTIVTHWDIKSDKALKVMTYLGNEIVANPVQYKAVIATLLRQCEQLHELSKNKVKMGATRLTPPTMEQFECLGLLVSVPVNKRDVYLELVSSLKFLLLDDAVAGTRPEVQMQGLTTDILSALATRLRDFDSTFDISRLNEEIKKYRIDLWKLNSADIISKAYRKGGIDILWILQKEIASNPNQEDCEAVLTNLIAISNVLPCSSKFESLKILASVRKEKREAFSKCANVLRKFVYGDRSTASQLLEAEPLKRLAEWFEGFEGELDTNNLKQWRETLQSLWRTTSEVQKQMDAAEMMIALENEVAFNEGNPFENMRELALKNNALLKLTNGYRAQVDYMKILGSVRKDRRDEFFALVQKLKDKMYLVDSVMDTSTLGKVAKLFNEHRKEAVDMLFAQFRRIINGVTYYVKDAVRIVNELLDIGPCHENDREFSALEHRQVIVDSIVESYHLPHGAPMLIQDIDVNRTLTLPLIQNLLEKNKALFQTNKIGFKCLLSKYADLPWNVIKNTSLYQGFSRETHTTIKEEVTRQREAAPSEEERTRAIYTQQPKSVKTQYPLFEDWRKAQILLFDDRRKGQKALFSQWLCETYPLENRIYNLYAKQYYPKPLFEDWLVKHQELLRALYEQQSDDLKRVIPFESWMSNQRKKYDETPSQTAQDLSFEEWLRKQFPAQAKVYDLYLEERSMYEGVESSFIGWFHKLNLMLKALYNLQSEADKKKKTFEKWEKDIRFAYDREKSAMRGQTASAAAAAQATATQAPFPAFAEWLEKKILQV